MGCTKPIISDMFENKESVVCLKVVERKLLVLKAVAISLHPKIKPFKCYNPRHYRFVFSRVTLNYLKFKCLSQY